MESPTRPIRQARSDAARERVVAAALKAAGVLSEEQAGPFAALAKLKGGKPDEA